MSINPKSPSERRRQQGIRMNAQKAAVKDAVRKANKAAPKAPKPPTAKKPNAQSKPRASRRPRRNHAANAALVKFSFSLLTKKWFWITMLSVVFILWLIQ